MKRNLFAAVGMLLIIFSFIACNNDTRSLDREAAETIAEELDPRTLVENVLKDGEKDGIDIAYDLKAVDERAKLDHTHVLEVAIAFSGYEYSRGITIDSGSIIYTFYGTMNGSRFSSHSYELRTVKHMVISGTSSEGPVDVELSIDARDGASGTNYSVSLGNDKETGETIATGAPSVAVAIPDGEQVRFVIGGTEAEIPAEEPAPDPDPTPSWQIYGFAGGNGSENSPFIISDITHLNNLRTNVSKGTSFSGNHFRLDADIDLSGESAFVPIGNASRLGGIVSGSIFKGMFDGNQHKIILPDMTAWEITDDTESSFGLFSAVSGAGSGVKNLTVSGKLVSNSESAGMIAGLISDGAVIENCTTEDGSSIEAAEAGGLVGRMMGSGSISKSTNNADVTATAGKAGGLAHSVYYPSESSSLVIAESHNTGNIVGQSYTGGLVGIATGVDISGSDNSGSVTASKYIGGLIGRLNPDSTMTGCENTGAVCTPSEPGDYSIFGGLVGAIGGTGKDWNIVTISSSENNGTFSFGQNAVSAVGGIVGLEESSSNGGKTKEITISGSSNSADIDSNGESSIGGIIGVAEGNLEITEGTSNSGDIKGKARIGGLVGYAGDSVVISGSSNTGAISGESALGGLIAYAPSDNIEISNSENEGNITVIEGDGDGRYAGGIAGHILNAASVSITGVSNSGDVSTRKESGEYFGGIIGGLFSSKSVSITADNSGSVTSSPSAGAGGIIGYVASNNESITVSSSNNSGNITGGSGAGGIINNSAANGLKIIGCTNTGTIEAKGYTNAEGKFVTAPAGGIIGDASASPSLYIENCINGEENGESGSITGMSRVGGIAGGILPEDTTIKGSTNHGLITGIYRVGGIAGQTSTGNTKFENCHNTGDFTNVHSYESVSPTETRYGGIIGLANGPVKIMNSSSSGKVSINPVYSLNPVAGGLVGTASGSMTISDSSSQMVFEVTDDTVMGGLVGRNSSDTISSFERCDVTGEGIEVLVGSGESKVEFIDCTLNDASYPTA